MDNSVYTYSDHFIKVDEDFMRPDCDYWEKYGKLHIPKNAKKFFDGRQPGYRIKAVHPSPSFWGNSQNNVTVLKKFTEQLFANQVEWSDPNHICKHCGRFYDPAYEFIEDETILSFLEGQWGDEKWPDYCPECEQDFYDFCNNAAQAFYDRDKIKD